MLVIYLYIHLIIIQVFVGGALIGRLFVDQDSKDLGLVMLLNGMIAVFVANTLMMMFIGRRPLLVPIVTGSDSSSYGKDIQRYNRFLRIYQMIITITIV